MWHCESGPQEDMLEKQHFLLRKHTGRSSGLRTLFLPKDKKSKLQTAAFAQLACICDGEWYMCSHR